MMHLPLTPLPPWVLNFWPSFMHPSFVCFFGVPLAGARASCAGEQCCLPEGEEGEAEAPFDALLFAAPFDALLFAALGCLIVAKGLLEL
jgi:hypothetical protein